MAVMEKEKAILKLKKFFEIGNLTNNQKTYSNMFIEEHKRTCHWGVCVW
jgi:hypothetical protein